MSRRSSRTSIAITVVVILLAAVFVWIARNTYWERVPVPMPLHGEALINPYYAAQHFAESLGAKTERQQLLGAMPEPTDVIVLGTWHWDLIGSRRTQMERWVEAGGRLIVDRSLIGSVGTFSRWSGIDRLEADEYDESDEEDKKDEAKSQSGRRKPPATLGTPFEQDESCRRLGPEAFRLCTYDDGSKLVPMRHPVWSLKDRHGAQVLRMSVGRGSVTAINATPFLYRQFTEGDHARLFVAATQLARGDHVFFIAESDHPTLLKLLWLYAAPAVTLGLCWVALALWRNAVRLGPAIPPQPNARRSLGEQIRGTGRFITRLGNSAALHRAEVRALDAAGSRRIASYQSMSQEDRAAQIARLANLEPGSLLAAVQLPAGSRLPQIRGAIELLETARRRISPIGKGY
jgi:hypothetical protein